MADSRSSIRPAYPTEREHVYPTETLPQDRCESCGAPGEWEVSYTGQDDSRDPPFRFFHRTFCDEHLPTDARTKIPEYITQ